MTSNTRARVGMLSGVGAAVAYAIGAVLPGTPLKPDDPLPKVISHFVDKRGALLASMVLGAVAVALALFFLGYLRAALSAADDSGSPLATVTVAAWLSLFLIITAGGLLQTAIIWRGADTVDPKLAQAAFDMANLSLFSVSAAAALLSVLGPTIVIWRSRMLPRWLVALGAVEMAINVVELAGIGSRTGANAAGYAGGAGPLVWVIWVAALSVMLFRTQPRLT